jgi:hypothetical protein
MTVDAQKLTVHRPRRELEPLGRLAWDGAIIGDDRSKVLRIGCIVTVIQGPFDHMRRCSRRWLHMSLLEVLRVKSDRHKKAMLPTLQHA